MGGKPARAGGLRRKIADDGARPCSSPTFEEHRRDARRKLARVPARRPVDDPIHRPREALGKHRDIDGNGVEGVFPNADAEERIILLYQGKRLACMARANKRDKLGETSLHHSEHEECRKKNACGRLFGSHARDEAASVVRAPRDARCAALRMRRIRRPRSMLHLLVSEQKAARRELHPVAMQIGIGVASWRARNEDLISRREQLVDDLGKRFDPRGVHARQVVEHHKRARAADLGHARCDDPGVEVAQEARTFAVDPERSPKREDDLRIFRSNRRFAKACGSDEEARDVAGAQKVRDEMSARMGRGRGDVLGAAALA